MMLGLEKNNINRKNKKLPEGTELNVNNENKVVVVKYVKKYMKFTSRNIVK